MDAITNIIKHIINRVNESDVLREPYKHMIIENFLPDNFYKLLSDNYPSDIRFYKNVKRKEQIVNNRSTRFVIHLDKNIYFDNWKNRLNDKQRIYLSILNNVVSSEGFLRNIFNKLERRDFYNKQYHTEIQIIRDATGYKIFPHCDTKKRRRHKYLTMLIYFPNSSYFWDIGTEVYKPNPLGNIYDKNNKKFKMFKKAPYIRNTLFTFVPEYDKTWHGVSEVKIPPNIERRSIQIFLKSITRDCFAIPSAHP